MCSYLTAVLQCCSAAGAGTITTIRYPAQLRAISCTFLPTAVLQKLSYHYSRLQHNLWIGWRLETHVLGYLSVSAQHQTHHILPWRVQCGVVAR